MFNKISLNHWTLYIDIEYGLNVGLRVYESIEPKEQSKNF